MRIFFSFLLLFILAAPVYPNTVVEQEVQYLLDYVEKSSCIFVRNGQQYTSAKARQHLEKKYNYARARIPDAETFIDRIASKSSMSGKKYMVSCRESHYPAGDWLHVALRAYRDKSLEQ